MYTVYLVDDEEPIITSLSTYFPWDGTGFSLVGFSNDPESVIPALERESVDVIISDIRMGKINGLDLVETLLSRKLARRAIFISGYAEFEYARKAMSLGSRDYLLKPIDHDELKSVLSRIREEFDRDNPDSQVQDAGYYAQIVQTVRNYLDNEYRLANLDEAARLVSLSPNYLSKLFRNETGKKFSDYLMEVKINQAKKLLRNVDMKIYEVAYHVGYDNPKNFTRAFKQYTGLSPWEFREGVESGN